MCLISAVPDEMSRNETAGSPCCISTWPAAVAQRLTPDRQGHQVLDRAILEDLHRSEFFRPARDQLGHCDILCPARRAVGCCSGYGVGSGRGKDTTTSPTRSGLPEHRHV